MTDKYFSDWEALASAVDAKADNILKQDVVPVAESILKRHIKSDIYDVYTPKENGWVSSDGQRTTYQRRNILEDEVISLMSNKTLTVTSTAAASPSIIKGHSFRNRYPGAFLKLLESGNMGIWRGGFPRPAIKNTQAEFDTGTAIKSAVKRGIKREIGNCIEL